MAGGSIANLNVKLTATINGFTSGMRAAVAPLKELGSTVTGVASHIFSLTGAITGIAAGGGLLLFAKNAAESIDATAKLSDRLGITTEALVGLQHGAGLAGVGTEELTGGLEKMLKSIGQAASGTGEALPAFAALGLSAKKLADESPDQALGEIADKLTDIHNPAERAARVMEIFGKSGQALLPYLMSGSEGIKAMEKDAQKLGLTFNRVDAARVEQANDAMSRLQDVFTGAMRTAVIQFAPFIEAAANKLTDLGTNGQGAAGLVVTGVEYILVGIAKLADWVELLKAGWYGFQAVTITAAYATVKALEGISAGLDWILKNLGMTGTGWNETLHAMADSLATQVDEAATKAGESMDRFTKGTNAAAVSKAFDEIRAKSLETAKATADNADKLKGGAVNAENFAKKLADAEERAKKIGEAIAGIQKDIDRVGLNDSEKKLADLEDLGASFEQLIVAAGQLNKLMELQNAQKGADAIKEMRKEIEQFNMTDAQKKVADLSASGVGGAALQQFKQLAEQFDAMKDGKDIIESLQTPLDNYEKMIGKLNNALSHGAINWQQYGQGVAKARAELEQSAKAPELLHAGSAEAQKALYSAPELDVSTKGLDTLNGDKSKVAEKQLTEARDSNSWLYRIERNTRDMTTAPATQTVDI